MTTPAQRRRAAKRARRSRPDHDARLVAVVCERCGLEQANGRDGGGCRACGHRYARYAAI